MTYRTSGDIADAGGAIFDNLPLLFAIGVAVGFAKDNNGVAASRVRSVIWSKSR